MASTGQGVISWQRQGGRKAWSAPAAFLLLEAEGRARGADGTEVSLALCGWCSRPWCVWLAVGSLLGAVAVLLTVICWEVRRRRQVEAALAAVKLREESATRLNGELEKKITEHSAQLDVAVSDLVRFKAIVDATSDFVNITSLDGRVLYMNPGARRMAGIGEEEDITRLHIRDLAPLWVLRRFEREGMPVAFKEGAWKSEVALLHRDGYEIPVSFVGLIIKSPDGRPALMACVARDISEQRRIADELKRALAEERELNELKSNFISVVSHEIRTPLALILSSAEILGRYLDRLPLEKRQRHLDTIEDAVHRMALLVENVLTFSRAEAGRLEFHPSQIDLTSFCRQLSDELSSVTRRRCPIRLETPERLDRGLGDPALLRHILGNLISNAVKYSPAGSPVCLRLRRQGETAVFSVEDKGCGIPEADQVRLFSPFHRGSNVTHVAGTGLGLVIVQRCVQKQGGQIEIASREGSGTTITVHLPLFPNASP
jgi:PAS domain S-box-containing protein